MVPLPSPLPPLLHSRPPLLLPPPPLHPPHPPLPEHLHHTLPLCGRNGDRGTGGELVSLAAQTQARGPGTVFGGAQDPLTPTGAHSRDAPIGLNTSGSNPKDKPSPPSFYKSRDPLWRLRPQSNYWIKGPSHRAYRSQDAYSLGKSIYQTPGFKGENLSP